MHHVLVIEDQYLFATVVADVALSAGADSVAIAEDEDGALALARKQRPTLILSDVDLQDGGRGPDAVRRIRREMGPVPAIFITGRPEDADAIGCASEILAKPVSVDQLFRSFNRLWGGSSAQH